MSWEPGWIDRIIERVEKLLEKHDNTIEQAKRLGTYDAIDRSKQYERADNRELLRAVNEAWSKIRSLEKSNGTKDAAIVELNKKLGRYRILNIALTSIITGLAWEGIKAVIAHVIR